MNKSRLIYRSQASSPFTERELLDLLHASRSYNSIDCIYGFLFYKNGFFLQVIEGQTEMVNDLFDRVKNDKRHFNIEVISNNSINEYLFSKWSMGCINFNDPRLSFIPGISGELDSKENIEVLIKSLPELSSFLLANPKLNL